MFSDTDVDVNTEVLYNWLSEIEYFDKKKQSIKMDF